MTGKGKERIYCRYSNRKRGKETEGKRERGEKEKVSRWDEERRGEEEEKYLPVHCLQFFFI